MRLVDIKWMDADLAARLEIDGVTVRSMAAASPPEFQRRYPYVGSINCWLLTSEAKYLVNIAGAGLWEPGRVEDAKIMRELGALEDQYRKRPEISVWPPPPPEPQQYSARVKRIRLSQGLPVDGVVAGG